MPDFPLPETTAARVEIALNDYGNERDWQKMRPDEMAHTALAAALQLDSDPIERVADAMHAETKRQGWRPHDREDFDALARAALQELGLLDEGGTDG